MHNNEKYMKRALELAKYGRFTTHPNPSVGCVIVKNDLIIGEGYHYRAGDPHAEVYALQRAGEKAKGATAYITLEPCNQYGKTPPCCKAIIQSGVSRVVIAMKDPNPNVSGKSIHYLRNQGIEVVEDILIDEAKEINKGFFKRMCTGFPYLQLKLGASIDGCTAMANGNSKWITSLKSRKDAQYFRAQSHAILTSSKTVLSDNPSLTVRWNQFSNHLKKIYPKDHIRQPLRIVIDSKNRVTPEYKIVQQPGETWIIRIKKDLRKWPKNVSQILVSENKGHIDLISLMLILGKKNINSILVEAGSTLSGALVQQKLIDELLIYLSPKLLGDNARGLVVLPMLEKLEDAPQFSFKNIRKIGSDLCLHLKNK